MHCSCFLQPCWTHLLQQLPCVGSLGFSFYSIASSAERDSFCVPSSSFSLLSCRVWKSQHNIGSRGLCLPSGLRQDCFSGFSPLSITFALYQLMKFPYIPILSNSFYHEEAFSSFQFSRSVVSDSLRPHESQHARPPCPSPTPGVHSDSRPWSP